MSRPVRERIVELELDVQQVRLAPAAAVRARGSRRARRRLAGTAVAVATLVTAAGFGLAGIGPKSTTPSAQGTAPAAGAVPCPDLDLRLPDDPAQVEVQVFAGTGATAQPARVADQLEQRRFRATAAPGTDPAAETGTILRYGPSAVGAAALLRALIGSDAVMKFDSARTGRTVDLVLGAGFARVATPTEMNQALATAGQPTAPPQCRNR